MAYETHKESLTRTRGHWKKLHQFLRESTRTQHDTSSPLSSESTRLASPCAKLFVELSLRSAKQEPEVVTSSKTGQLWSVALAPCCVRSRFPLVPLFSRSGTQRRACHLDRQRQLQVDLGEDRATSLEFVSAGVLAKLRRFDRFSSFFPVPHLLLYIRKSGLVPRNVFKPHAPRHSDHSTFENSKLPLLLFIRPNSSNNSARHVAEFTDPCHSFHQHHRHARCFLPGSIGPFIFNARSSFLLTSCSNLPTEDLLSVLSCLDECSNSFTDRLEERRCCFLFRCV